MADWLHSTAATVVGGAKEITFTDNIDMASVRGGDVVMVNGQIWECLSGTRPDAAGISKVFLALPWPYTGTANVEGHVFRTTHDLLQIASDARKLTNITKGYLATQKDILTGTTPTVDVPIGIDPTTGQEEILKVTPWQYIINIVNASLGNIAAIGAMSEVQSEALRAHNKEAFRASGHVHFGQEPDNQSYTSINSGLFSRTNSVAWANALGVGSDPATKLKGNSKTQQPVLNIAGVISEINLRSFGDNNGVSKIKFPTAPNGKTTHKKSGPGAGEVRHHTTVTDAFNYAALDPDNIEVVTDRVDMWGFEQFLEEVTSSNPFIYPGGQIQSQATIMDGIVTSASNRPVTYYAVFDGDTGSKGKSLDFFALTDAQKKAVCGNHKNNLVYLKDGRLVQWRLRQRTIAGAGNGDWSVINSTNSSGLEWAVNRRVKPQGILNSVEPFGYDDEQYLPNDNITAKTLENIGLGIYVTRQSGIAKAHNGECYLLVMGVVNRLNQGAYHPSFNPSGTFLLGNKDGNLNGAIPWYDSSAWEVNSTTDTFTYKTTNSTFNGAIGGASGRSDGRFFDAIYAAGQGGVTDYRLSAYDMSSPEEAAKIKAKVENGTYRGEEKLKFTKVLLETQLSANNTAYSLNIPLGTASQFAAGDMISVYDGLAGNILITKQIISAVGEDGGGTVDYISWSGSNPRQSFIRKTQSYYAVVTGQTSVSVSGEFERVGVIGDPANILATPQLANGWLGSWIPDIPEGSSTPRYFSLTRKALGSGNLPAYSTTNNGATWSLISFTTDYAINGVFFTPTTGRVVIVPYAAFAKQTKESTNKPLLNSRAGIGYVWYSSRGNSIPNGVLLAESTLGIILKDVHGANTDQTVPVLNTRLSNGALLNGYLSHAPLFSFGRPPGNNSHAIKALAYQIANNGQVSLGYQANELTHTIPVFTDNAGADSFVTGTFYRVTGTYGKGLYRAESSFSYNLDNPSVSMDTSGNIINSDNGLLLLRVVATDKRGSWGDDSAMKIVSGSDTFYDLNGQKNLAVSHELSIPYGWTNNHA